MVLHVLRALFVLLMAAVGYFYLRVSWLTMAIGLSLAVVFICVDILSPRKKLAIFAGTFFGLIVGLALAYALSFAVILVVDQAVSLSPPGAITQAQRSDVVQFVNLAIGIICCYLAISFILQTKDDFRFIIPYVEFSKQTKGTRPILLDTSVLIDGRIVDVAATGFFDSQMIVPRFVLDEMQTLADSSDNLKRNRGRRGLDVLGKLRTTKRADVVLYEATHQTDSDKDVDQKLMSLAKELNARVLSNDYNLGKVAQLREVDVININDLSSALKPVVLPGERMTVRLVKPGEEVGQGVGYLEDGTMVVVEHGRQHVNEEVEFVVTRALQTTAGRMIFGRMSDGRPDPRRPQRGRPDPKPDSHSPAAQGT
jgi:uncharacterized protein YacL